MGRCGLLLIVACLSACGGGSGDSRAAEAAAVDDRGGAAQGADCSGFCADNATRLTPADVQQVLAQVVAEADVRNQPGTAAVVDRVGNVLAVY